MVKFLTYFLWICAPVVALHAQQAISGRVLDPTGEPLAFVTILIDDQPGKGVLSDIEGRFYIGAEAGVHSLRFRYVGYEPLLIGSDFLKSKYGKPLEITLYPSNEQLPEAVIRAGDNPADRLIRLAIHHRDRNNPEKQAGYYCKTYNKVVFDVVPHRDVFEKTIAKRDTSKKRWQKVWNNFHKSEQQAASRHLFLMESVTDRVFKYPALIQERVLLNRVSGLQSTGIAALANMVQPFTCYGDFLRVLDKNYVNPVSPGSPKLYFFNIEDTLYREEDTLYLISFHPRKGHTFDGLQGVLHLSSHFWAVQAIRATPADENATLHIKIEQSYQCIRNQWFPKQLNFELELEKYPDPMMGMRAAGRSYIEDAVPDTTCSSGAFDPEMPLIFLPSADRQQDTGWQRWRTLAPLNDKEWRTYAVMDSVGKKYNLDRISKASDALVTGLIPVRPPLVFDLSKLVHFNEFENVRLGFGISNAQYRPLRPQRLFEAGIRVGYGFGDRAWKYGAYALWRISRSRQTQLRAAWSQDLLEPGALHELQPTAFVNRTLYAQRMDRVRQYTTILSTRLQPALLLQAALRQQHMDTDAYGYQYRANEQAAPTHTFTFTEATAYIRWARGERVQQLLGTSTRPVQPWPVVELGYTRGWGDHAYHRWVAAIYQSVPLRHLGLAEWRMEVGGVTSGVPVSKLFLLNQGGGSFRAFAVNNTFQSLPDTLLLADRFLNIYYAQEAGHIFYRSKYSSPFLTLVQNAAWGDLKYPERQEMRGFAVARRPYLESGIRLDHLLQFNYVNFGRMGIGAAMFYRWGFLKSKTTRENISLRLSLRFTMQ